MNYLKCIIVIILIFFNNDGTFAQDILHSTEAEKFENAIQQQSFKTILMAIEDRLQNLDKIYSIRATDNNLLFQNRLDNLEKKLNRMESIFMLNLERISENISTKNYKDDYSKTQIFRKFDHLYDAIAHKISSFETKFNGAFEKFQNKIDSVSLRLERMEEDSLQKNCEIETDITEIISTLEDQKRSAAKTDTFIHKISKISEQQFHIVNKINESLTNQNYSLTLYQENNLKTFNSTEEIKKLLSEMKTELKKDFNAYASKDSDMNMNLWMRNEETDQSLETLESIINSTRTEFHDGLRNLMIQIVKITGKGEINNEKPSIESLGKSINLSLEKLLTQQELFITGCHRVQINESQIEKEISDMLGQLLDMMDTKMAKVMENLRNIENSAENDNIRINKNLEKTENDLKHLTEKLEGLEPENKKR